MANQLKKVIKEQQICIHERVCEIFNKCNAGEYCPLPNLLIEKIFIPNGGIHFSTNRTLKKWFAM